MDVGRVEIFDQAGAHVLVAVGEHDLATVPMLHAEIDRLFAAGSRVVVDLSRAEFIDCSVISTLVAAHRKAEAIAEHAFAVVVAPDTEPKRVWELTAASSFLPTFATRAEALASARQQTA
jgi:anti-anti-sigma factor